MLFWLIVLVLLVIIAITSVVCAIVKPNCFWESATCLVCAVAVGFWIWLGPFSFSVTSYAKATGCISSTTVKARSYSVNKAGLTDQYQIAGQTYVESSDVGEHDVLTADINHYKSVGKPPKYRAVVKRKTLNRVKLADKLSAQGLPGGLANIASVPDSEVNLYE